MSVESAKPLDVYTVCFCGTLCTRDEGEESRSGSDKRIYSADTGYIPVRIHKEISGGLHATTPSVTVRGVAQNDWAGQDQSEQLILYGKANPPDDLVRYAERYAHGEDQRSRPESARGQGAVALALHAANLAAASPAPTCNFVGHSRGAMECIMAAWFLYAYGGSNKIRVNILAIDPVPGTGEWYGIITQLPPNVDWYVGITAWDHLDAGFSGLVPRPTAAMAGNSVPTKLGETWSTLADNCQLTDPLAPNDGDQPRRYKLFACRGRHATVAGNATSDGQYDPDKVTADAARVPQLVYRLARAYLTLWGTTFAVPSAVGAQARRLRQMINLDHGHFDVMGGGPLRDSILPGRRYVRRVSSIMGRDLRDKYCLEDVAGDPPYRQTYPVTAARTGAGWVTWNYL